LIPTDSPHLGVVAFSHPGETGKNNEDRFSVTSYRLEAKDRPCLLAAVADGIGGHQAGEVAAELAIETLVNTLAPSSGVQPVRELRAAVLEAARAVARASQESPEREGMGSTLSVAWIIGLQLYIASVGDSRIYLLRRNHLAQLTTDHTWIQEALDRRIITPEQAHEHPNMHMLRRHLGGREEPEPDMRLRLPGDRSNAESEANQGARLEPGDQLLLCSDGLTDLVRHAEIRQALSGKVPMEAGQTLVDLARARGGHDNITLVLLTVPGIPKKRLAKTGPRARRWLGWGLASLVGSLALVCITLAAALITWWFGVGPLAHPRQAGTPTPAVVTPIPAELTSTSTP
jgi:serine/threonine protein phosphatase PrpC